MRDDDFFVSDASKFMQLSLECPILTEVVTLVDD